MMIFEDIVKNAIRKRAAQDITFNMLDIKFVLKIYADPEIADSDNSKSLSIPEAAALALSLSFDGISAGIAAAIDGAKVFLIFPACFIFGIAAIASGSFAGRRISHIKTNINWIPGAVFIALGLSKLF